MKRLLSIFKRKPKPCDHGVTFDRDVAEDMRMTAEQVRQVWPRLWGDCPKGCGFHGIAYASFAHFIYGDW